MIVGAGAVEALSAAPGWALVPMERSPSVSFDAGLSPAAWGAASVWRMDLDGTVQRRTARLDARAAAVDATRARRDEAWQRLVRFTADATSAAPFAAGAVMPGPEAELAALLGTAPPTQGPVAFGWWDVASRWDEIAARFREATERLTRFLASLAVVESRLDEAVVARSLLRADGDLDTIWTDGLDPELVSAHARSLGTAIQARLAVVATLQTLLKGAVLIATLPALAGNPAALVMALPAAWSFIEELLTGGGAP